MPEMVDLTLDTPALAQAYDRVSDRQFRHGKFLIHDLALSAGERVLDVGCGTGRLAAHVADIVGNDGIVHAIDPLPLRMEIAKKIGRPNLKAEAGRAEDLSRFSEASFDAVYFNSVFHWISDQELVLRECRRVLRTGGRVGISAAAKERPHDIDRIAGALKLSSQVPASAPHKISRRQLSALFDRCGFIVAQMKIRSCVDVFENSEEAIAFYMASSFGNFLSHVPAGSRDTALAAVSRELERIRTADGIRLRRNVLFAIGIARRSERSCLHDSVFC